MKNFSAGLDNLHEGGQLSPVSSTTITVYLNSAINKRKIGRITKHVIHKSRNCQTQVQGLSITNPGRWRLLRAHLWCGECQQTRKSSGLALLVLTQVLPVSRRKDERDAYSV
jgi:hypothetical protein